MAEKLQERLLIKSLRIIKKYDKMPYRISNCLNKGINSYYLRTMALDPTDWIAISGILVDLLLTIAIVYLVNVILQRPKGPIFEIHDPTIKYERLQQWESFDGEEKREDIEFLLTYHRSNDGDKSAYFKYRCYVWFKENTRVVGRENEKYHKEQHLAPGQFESNQRMRFSLPLSFLKKSEKIEFIFSCSYYSTTKKKTIYYHEKFLLPNILVSSPIEKEDSTILG